MQRRDFFTGLLGVVPSFGLKLPSIDLVGAEPEPQTMNQLLVQLENRARNNIKRTIERWGFRVEYDSPRNFENLYFGSGGCVVTKLRRCNILKLEEDDHFHLRHPYYLRDDFHKLPQFIDDFSRIIVKDMKWMKFYLEPQFPKIVFLNITMDYYKDTREWIKLDKHPGAYTSKSNNDGKLEISAHYNWVRKGDIKVRDREHLGRLLSAGDNWEKVV